jgi:putative hydrolase of the HAD superfamily
MMYVGDNPEKDFYIGKIYSIKTVRINRNGLYSGASYLHGVKENISITSLSELLAN